MDRDRSQNMNNMTLQQVEIPKEEIAAEEDDVLTELPLELGLEAQIECMKAMAINPEMFISGFDADDQGIEEADDPDSPGERLLLSAEEGNAEIAEELLSVNPELVTYKDKDGYTPLHRAAYSENVSMIRLLISKGAKIDEVTDDGWTALHSGCYWNSFKSVRELVDNNADINVKSKGGHTPLHIASNQQSRECMIILLTCLNIDVKATNDIGETAEDMAKRSGRFGFLFDMHRNAINKL